VGMTKAEAQKLIRKYPRERSNGDKPGGNTHWVCPRETELAGDHWLIYGPSTWVTGSVKIAEMKFQNDILDKIWVYTMQ